MMRMTWMVLAVCGALGAQPSPSRAQALSAAQVYLSLVTADNTPIEAQVVIPN